MNDTSRPETYYSEVASYYDDDARDFEKRYEENPVLKRIRHSFRELTEVHAFRNVLEIGCGPGFDVCYFAEKYPDSTVYALDVSPEMIRICENNVRAAGLSNVKFGVGSVEDVPKLFPDQKFDLVYVYFGGLNTVFDLSQAARDIDAVCTNDVTLVLTFVNRYYLTEIPLWLAKGRVGKAFERLTNTWRGYSDLRKIPSRPYAASDIRKAFGDSFEITYRRGYSLFYPAWYRSHLLASLGAWSDRLWRLDSFLAKTPFWNMGEYSLYTMKRKP